MIEETVKSNNEANTTSNQYFTSAGALQIRLNVEPLIAQLELDIRGLSQEFDPETKSIVLKKTGDPLFNNDVGIRSFMSFVRGIVNVQVVQGNLDEDSYGDYMQRIHKGISKDLMINRYKYGLALYDYEKAVNRAMLTIEGFLTRSLGNKERDSYSHTMKHVESNQQSMARSGLFNFNRNG